MTSCTQIDEQTFLKHREATTIVSMSSAKQLTEERLLSIGVECYAGHRGEQTPRTLILGDRRMAVAEVLDAWLAPDHRYFKLKAADGDTYLVRHDERSDTWELTMFRSKRVDA
jgi:hypothetical protein